MSQFIVGVTGGIGSGKTTVTDAFQNKGITVIDADVIAREVVAKGSNALAQIATHFGTNILFEDGTLNRAELRNRIFKHEHEKQWLNNLLHPIIRQQIEFQLDAAQSSYAILSAPLLLENKLTYLTNRMLVVDINETTQLSRTVERDNNDASQVRAIMAAQIDRKARLQAADDVLNNDGSLEDVYDQVDALHLVYLKLAAENQPGNPST